jgi:hypothetical protein
MAHIGNTKTSDQLGIGGVGGRSGLETKCQELVCVLRSAYQQDRMAQESEEISMLLVQPGKPKRLDTSINFE